MKRAIKYATILAMPQAIFTIICLLFTWEALLDIIVVIVLFFVFSGILIKLKYVHDYSLAKAKGESTEKLEKEHEDYLCTVEKRKELRARRKNLELTECSVCKDCKHYDKEYRRKDGFCYNSGLKRYPYFIKVKEDDKACGYFRTKGLTKAERKELIKANRKSRQNVYNI